MRKNYYSHLQNLRLAPICSERSLQHTGEIISRLRLRKLVVVGLAAKARPLLRLRYLVENLKIGNHKPRVQSCTNFNFKDIVTCRGTFLSMENLSDLVLQYCTSIGGVISKLGEQGKSHGGLRSLIVRYVKRRQQVDPITAITTANEPLGKRVEVEPGRANRKIQLINACKFLEEAQGMLEAIKNSRKTLKYLCLSTPTFFTVQDIAQLNTYQNLRQLSLCLCLSPDKISRVFRALPPGFELLELSYRNRGCDTGAVVRELMLMTYSLKRRTVETMAGCFPLKCIITTELRPWLDGDSLHSRTWLVDEDSGSVFVYDGGPFPQFAKIGVGISKDVL
ncbi:hypothetical protein HOY80DRAFT_1096915 [Tuber brumale]|nr:hypothetical protein HOY80DRAFT_1096915 [Tuber brumale]